MKYTFRNSAKFFHNGTDIIYLEDDAKVIVIPGDGSKSKMDWNVYSAGSFFRGDSNQYSVVCFNPDELNFTNLVTIIQSPDITRTKASKIPRKIFFFIFSSSVFIKYCCFLY